MKKFILTFYAIGLLSILPLFAQENSLRVQSVRNSWSNYPATITSAEVFIQPRGLFVEYNLYLQYSAKSNYSNTIKDTFEVQHYFKLPENTLVVDSWLWVNNTIMKAFLLDRWSAFNIYEGIVKRRQDPSILYKNSSTNYEYRIFPLAGGEGTRKVKLTFLLPAKWRDGKLEIGLPVNIINKSYQIPDFKINVIPGVEWTNPAIAEFNSQFKIVSDAINGVYYTTTVPSSKLSTTDQIILSFTGIKTNVYFSHYKDKDFTDEGYYQFAIQPQNFIKLNNAKKKVVYFLDHESGNTNFTPSNVKESLKRSMLANLVKGDSFNIVYTRLLPRKVSEKFISADTASILNAINLIDLGLNANIKAGLPVCYDFLKKNSGTHLIILSSSSEFSTIKSAQDFKNSLEKEYGSITQTFVLNYSYSNIGVFQFYSGQYFYGNDLFYKILTSNSLGTFRRASTISDNYSIDFAFSKLWNDISSFEYKDRTFEILIRPENGICFDKYEINSNAALLDEPIIQMGRYKGELPFNLEAVAIVNGNVSSTTIVLPTNNWNLNNEVFKQIHLGQKLKALEEKKLSTGSHISAIVELSKKANILSIYTSFLALEPGLQDTCKNCVDQTKGGTISSDEAIEDELKIKVFPNPFKDKVTIEINGIASIDEIKSMEIYNIQGSLVHKFKDSIVSENKITLTWESENEATGIYIFKLTTKDKVKTVKLVKY